MGGLAPSTTLRAGCPGGLRLAGWGRGFPPFAKYAKGGEASFFEQVKGGPPADLASFENPF